MRGGIKKQDQSLTFKENKPIEIHSLDIVKMAIDTFFPE